MHFCALPVIKQAKPALKATSATALQNATKHVDNAFSRFFKGESKYPTNAGVKIAHKAIDTAQLNKTKVRVVSPEFMPQIRLRRNHLQRLVSLGTRNYYQPEKLRHTVKTVLNGWIRMHSAFTDSKTIALAWS